MTKINVTATIPNGYTADDVLAELLRTQHERALIERSEIRVVAPELAQVTIRYGKGAGAAEIDDVVDRLGEAQIVSVLAVSVSS